jgi:2-methylcitrate dehydratase PrpD
LTAIDDHTVTSTRLLADFLAGLSPAVIPGEVFRHARLCLLDTIGCGLFGASLPQASIVRDMLAAQGSTGEAPAWGAGGSFPAADAALANGTAVHAFELDDLHPRSIVHPGSVVAPAAFGALSLRPGLTGTRLLTAIIAGYEATARVGSAVGSAHLIAGWHPTGTHGTLGAAAGAGVVLGLDAPALANALGIAGSQSAGLMAAQYESMVKRFHAGRAAQSGTYAALLAERGYIGIKDLFEAGYGGYLGTFSPRADPSWLTRGLGTDWETLRVGFKPYSTNGSCHPAIDCLRELRARHGLTRADVEAVEICASTATVKHVGWRYRPDTVTTAQMNLPYIVAVVLTDGEAFIDQFTEERIREPDLVEFAGRVQVRADPDIDAQGDGGRHQTRLRVLLRDGRTLEAERDHAHGSAADPMPVTEVREKFRRLAGTVLDDPALTRIEAVIDRLETASDLRELGELLHPGPA